MVDVLERAEAAPPAHDLEAARRALADEWRAADPRTPEAIAAFYRDVRGIGDDLDAWHATDARQSVTDQLVHVAKASGAKAVVDIGAGRGHDLAALRDALPDLELCGVEPNTHLRLDLHARYLKCVGDVLYAPIEDADLLGCVDVLEHVPDPEDLLGQVARRAKLGCLLFEAVGSHDTGTPLHLPGNRGWHPGRVLERHGWQQIDRSGRVRVWRRVEENGRQRASLLLCAHRSVSAEHLTALMRLCAGDIGWRLRTKTGDALISRSRAIVVTGWWRETADDVFVMVDDDIVFGPDDADRLAELCRGGHDIICGAYPVHDGGHLACRFLPNTGTVHFGPGGQPPIEIEYAATGFMAVHRRVIDALVATLPLCHADQPWSFYPLFQPAIAEHPTSGHEWLSEDWGFCKAARDAGFRVWLDPQTVLSHLGNAAVSVRNMAAIHAALKGA